MTDGTRRAALMAGVSLAAVSLAFRAASAGETRSPWANVADPVFLRVDSRTLPHPAVYAVTQDAAGFLWVGTPGGLARYDGYRFRNYVANQSEPKAPPGVQALVADPRGMVWIGTPSSGLASLDESTESFRSWPADPAARNGPRSATVIALARAPDGRLWVGGDSGLDLFDPASGSFERAALAPEGEAQPRVEAILVDRTQGVWVATVHGLYQRPAGEERFRRFVPGALKGFESRTFFSLYEDAAGRLWIGSLNAVFVLDAERRLVDTYSSSKDGSGLGPGEQWGIIEATPGVFWIASYDGGMSVLDTTTRHVRRVAVDRANPGGLTPGDVWQFFRDRSGLIWVANGPGGLLAHNPLNRGIYELSSKDTHLGAGDIGARTVSAAPGGQLWLGGAESVVRLDPVTGAKAEFTVPNHPSVQTVYCDGGGTLWIGTMQGLCRLAPQEGRVECPGGVYQDVGRVFSVTDSGGTLWVGSGAGVFAIDERTGRATRYRHSEAADSLSNDFVTILYADRAGSIWAGTTNGLNRIDPSSGRVARFVHDPRNPNSIGTGAISSIVQDRRGRIWAGAVGGPLNVLTETPDGGAKVVRLGVSEGLAENVDGLAEDPAGHIWASASNALACIDPDTLQARLLGPAEGVQETEFWTRAVSRSRDGTLFFAGTYAATVIAPGARAEWTYAPPVAITALKVGARALSRQARAAPVVELPAGGRDVSVEFAALDYSAPEALRYAYKLDGYNRDWIDADAAHRAATYTNLAPGHYTLRVRATNRLGAWSTNAIALELLALPAWYETWWWHALLGVLGALGVLVFIRTRTRVLRRRAERLEQVVAERTADLARANAALEEMTVTDALTGLRNRRFLLQRIEEEIALSLRHQTDLVFFLVDVDHFKKVNDELGHAAGDQVLQQMRERLEHVFRASDYVLRWGGEEFLAMTRGSPRADAPEIAERLRATIADRPFVLDGGQPLAKTASIGFAAFPFVPGAARAVSWTRVVELADEALYRAKNGGRNTWVGLAAAPGADPDLLSSRLALPEAALRDGLLTLLSRPSPS